MEQPTLVDYTRQGTMWKHVDGALFRLDGDVEVNGERRVAYTHLFPFGVSRWDCLVAEWHELYRPVPNDVASLIASNERVGYKRLVVSAYWTRSACTTMTGATLLTSSRLRTYILDQEDTSFA